MKNEKNGKKAWFDIDPSKRKKRRFGGFTPLQTTVNENERYTLLLQELAQELEATISNFETQHGYTPSLSELSSLANISVDRILQIFPQYEQEQPETEREETRATDLLYADEFLDAAEAYLSDWQRKVRRIYFQFAAQDVKTTAGILGISEDEVYEVFAASNEVLSEVSMRMRHGTFSSQASASGDSSHTGVEHIFRGYNSNQVWELQQQLPLYV